MVDFATARTHMVDGQVRIADVTDLRIIGAMQHIERERFVLPHSRDLAYVDFDLAVAPGRTLMKPRVLAKLIQVADVGGSDRVLDVGCATGYGAAVLGRMAAQVTALEEDPELARMARASLAMEKKVEVVENRLVQGWAATAPYDVIVMEGATEVMPDALLRQLGDGGRLVCILGGDQAAKAMLYVRSGEDVGGRAVFDAAAGVLPGFAKVPAFSF
jgi:protein-L-isoaspartate(D-aspartate) O-methyltransferase